MTDTATMERPASRRARLAAALRAPLRLLLDVALPPLCPACREPVGDATGLCAACWSKLSPIERPFCERLGIPFVYDPGPGILSMQAIADPPSYQRARAVVRYDDVARALVHALKYGDRLDLAPTMGRWMARSGREILADADLIVPVGHISVDESRRLAQAAPDLPLIVSGHSHTYLKEGVREGNTLIVQTGSKGSALGRVDLWLDPATRRVVKSEARVVNLLEEPAPKWRSLAIEAAHECDMTVVALKCA